MNERTEQMEKIGFGVLGAGMISGIHADALRKSEKGKLVAICDVRTENAQSCAPAPYPQRWRTETHE